MPSAGYAALQVIPSMRGIDQMLRRQLVEPTAAAGDQAGEAAGSNLREKLKGGAAAAGVAAGAVLVVGITKAMERANISSTLQAQLGSGDKVAAAQGKVAGKLYSSGVSGSFQEAADAIKSVVQSGLAPPGATNKQLQAIATKASDVANVFGQDLGGVTNAVSQMMRTGLAKNSTQAFDLITKGFQGGTDKAGDFLDTINEYGTQFRKAGLDGATSIGLLNQAIRAGARDSDIAADAIKEFSIRAVDGSELSQEGFKALGLNADRMAAKFGKGGKSATAALDTTLDRLRGMKDPVEQSAAATALFGTQAEDLGEALFAMDPSKASKGLGKVGGAADKMGKVIHSGPAHALEVFKRRVETGLVTLLGTHVLPVITDVAHWLNDNLGPAARGAGKAFGAIVGVIGDVVGWFREFGVWLIPAAIAVGGLTLALNAQAIATALVTAVFSAYRAAILIGTAVTNGFAAAQALLNAVMALNPFVLVAIAVVALGAALVIAYKKSETFRKIVQGAMNGIRIAAMWLWDKALRPFFAWFGKVITWLWNTIIKPYFNFIVGYWKLIGRIAMWLWKSVLAPVFRAIGAVIKWWWNTFVKRYFQLVMGVFRRLGQLAVWLWKTIIKPTFNGIVAAARLWWTGVKKYFSLVMAGLRAVASVFRWLYKNVIKPVWNSIKSTISNVWNKGIKPAFNAVKSAIGKVADAFGRARDAIKKAWNKVSGIAKKPIGFVINTVYNRGIVGVWNKVAKAFGADPLKEFHPKGFARGGILPGQSSYRQGDDQLVPMRRGEGVYVSEAMRDPYERARLHAVNAAAMRGRPLDQFRDAGFANGGILGGGFAKGGIFDWIGKGLQGVGGSAWDFVKKGASWLKDTIAGSARAGLRNVVDPLIRQIPGVDNGFGRMLRRLPRRMIDAIFGFSEQADKKMVAAGVGGKGTRGALRWARAQAGKPYIWGGVGPRGYDCSGFMGAIQNRIVGRNPHQRMHSTFAFSGNRAPSGWQRGMRAPFMIGITNRGVGHTAGTLNGVNVESRGGDGVVVGSRARGHRSGLFGSWYGYAPSRKYDSGGVLPPGYSTVYNGTRKPEVVLTGRQWQAIYAAADAGIGDLHVRVYVGNREITDIARAEVRRSSGELATTLRAGRRGP